MAEELMEFQSDDDQRNEMIEGVIYNTAAGTPTHARVIGNLYALVYSYFLGKYCQPFTSELDIILDDKNRYRPDISIVCDSDKFSEKGYHGAPAMVIEVLSPSTAKIDKTKKFFAYQRHGVEEYWIVDPNSECIEQYINENGKFLLRSIHLNLENRSQEPVDKLIDLSTIIKSEVFAGLTLELPKIFEKFPS